jgi:AGZA family xanthine/uracil permease-like MFS transporter
MHGEAIGVGQTPVVAASYLGIAAVLAGCAKFAQVAPKPAALEHAHGALPQPAE